MSICVNFWIKIKIIDLLNLSNRVAAAAPSKENEYISLALLYQVAWTSLKWDLFVSVLEVMSVIASDEIEQELNWILAIIVNFTLLISSVCFESFCFERSFMPNWVFF